MPATLSITAMVPCFNEEECIEQAYLRIKEEVYPYGDAEILFVDDGSTDATLSIIKRLAADDPRVSYISFARNFGLESAFTAGFSYASKEWTVQLDADLQSPPAEIHKLTRRAVEGDYDAVFAVRTGRQDPWYRRLGTVGHQAIATRILGIELPVHASVFRVVRTSVARKVAACKVSTPYFLATLPLIGARYTTVETAHSPRAAGVAKWSLTKLFRHAADLFVGFSYRPLALIYLAALGAAAAAVALTAAGSGLQPLALASVLLHTAGLGALALLARYMVRVMRGSAGLPRYQIREANVPVRPQDHLYADPHAGPDAGPVAAGPYAGTHTGPVAADPHAGPAEGPVVAGPHPHPEKSTGRAAPASLLQTGNLP
ncbi:glycosyltransferase family 2 protein [Streptomyces arboris]|uniref:glycosyltransferase family 2 protein n=1 Tax=Streptomyces arboris TaxID=2600619 RepID=UPI003C301B05